MSQTECDPISMLKTALSDGVWWLEKGTGVHTQWAQQLSLALCTAWGHIRRHFDQAEASPGPAWELLVQGAV